jgi:hypothetical protein
MDAFGIATLVVAAQPFQKLAADFGKINLGKI